MQQCAALVRLPPIALIPRESVPNARRKELAELTKDRQAARGRIFSGAAMTFLTGFFCLAYGAGAVLAWTNGGHVAFRLLFSIFCAGLLVANRYLMGQTLEACGDFRRLAASADLLRDADIEQTLDEAVRALNMKALDWNEAAAIADANGLGGASVVRLRWHREDLVRRREAIAARCARLLPQPSAPDMEPRVLPPPSDWGHVVPIDLKSR